MGWWGRRRLTGANLRAWIVGVCRFAEPGRVGTPCFCGGVKSASLVARMALRAAFCGGGGAGVTSLFFLARTNLRDECLDACRVLRRRIGDGTGHGRRRGRARIVAIVPHLHDLSPRARRLWRRDHGDPRCVCGPSDIFLFRDFRCDRATRVSTKCKLSPQDDARRHVVANAVG